MTKLLDDTLKTRLYMLYDVVSAKFEDPFFCMESELPDVLNHLANSVNSKYYGHENDYQLFKGGEFDHTSGVLISEPPYDKVCDLALYVDKHTRDIQTCIQTLNFLPNGYFKMPKEMQESIQSKIDEQINYYTEEFIKPTLKDVNLTPNAIDDSNS